MKLRDWLILVIPVVVIALVVCLPFVPDMIPMQFNAKGGVNWSMPKWLFPIVGVLPFVVYKSIQIKKGS